MAIFGPKPWVNPFGKISIFRLFEHLVFIAQKAVFSFQNIVKDIFLTYIALKWPFLDHNHGLTPLEICKFFDCLNFFFSQPRKPFFVLEYLKRHFPELYCLKNKVGKMATFGPKPWVNPFAKMSIFRLFELLLFSAQKALFSFQKYRKRHFPGLYS